MTTTIKKKLQTLAIDMEYEFQKNLTPAPDLLYHYTDANGLLGILESKEIFLTQSDYLNDSSELIHGWEITKKIIGNHVISDKSTTSFLLDLLEHENP